MIFAVPLASIMMFCGRRSWCSISRRWKALQALRDLLDDAAHRLEIGPRMIDHPLRERVAFDVLHGEVDRAARFTRRARLGDEGAVDALSDPLLHQEALEVRRVAALVDRRRLDDERRVGLLVEREVDVAARARVQLAHDLVSLEAHARFEKRRERQFGELAGRVSSWQGVDPHDLHREVVGAAALVGLGDDARARRRRGRRRGRRMASAIDSGRACS